MKQLLIAAIFLLLISCGDSASNETPEIPPLIPQPQLVEQENGSTQFSNTFSIEEASTFSIASFFLTNFLEEAGMLNKKSTHGMQLKFMQDTTLLQEAYRLKIENESITLSAKDEAGAFFGVQTLRQLLPISLEEGKLPKNITLPLLTIEDAPRFPYRGVHLDVGRHFFDVDFIKKYISAISLLKMNRFHWHLTEDQGWRIEIKKYPKLTSHGAFREATLEGHYNDSPRKYDTTRYGGFYTQEEIKEVVAYAQSLNITIIPEIEMPGHAQAAISSYPELGCTGEQVPVAAEWGVFEEVYCPKESTFEFLENVLSEVIELFPGPYIHIGGDEAPKTHWKNCYHCQNLIEKEGLADEHELQSYFIRRIEKFLNDKGKKLIGWDEILEGGLAPNATVMSWRGMQGGIDAAKQGHPVIMTPTSHCYFDYYQSENPNEPLAIGGFLPLEKVYNLNPIPDSLTKEEGKYILGAQGNVWTEYMDTEDQVEYMLFPRLLALSEVVWTGPAEERNGNFSEFAIRAESFLERLDALNLNYANHFYELEGSVFNENDSLFYDLHTLSDKTDIQYTLNKGEPKRYKEPIVITEDSFIEAHVIVDGQPKGSSLMDTVYYHKGIPASLKINIEPHPSYDKGGIEALNNGRLGSETRYGDSEWLGFWGEDLELEYSFQKAIELNSVDLRFFNAPGQWIYSPKVVMLMVILENGKTIQVMKAPNPKAMLVNLKLDTFGKHGASLVKGLKIKIPNYGVIPEGKQGAGNKAWTFIDEIIIR